MEFENTPAQLEETDSNNIDIREIIDRYMQHWKWFALSVFLCCLFTLYNLNFSRKTYEANATIKIKDEKGGDRSTLSVFQDLGIMPSSKDNIEDEMEILKSKSLISEVITSLKLNIKFYSGKNSLSEFLDSNLGMSTEFYENERYGDPPVNLNFFLADSLVYKLNTSFKITIDSESKYTFFDKENDISKKYSFGDKMPTDFGDIIITPNNVKEKRLLGESIIIEISSLKDLTTSYAERINIQPKSE